MCLLVGLLVVLWLMSCCNRGSAQTVQSPAPQHFIEFSQSLSEKHFLGLNPNVVFVLQRADERSGHIPGFVGSKIAP